jgi:CheY-like chemotaxis protein
MRILLVENDLEWLGLIHQALPEYQVDTANSYAEAAARIGDGLPYDAAIVDLNLMDSPAHRADDRLGGKILLQLLKEHPLTRRLAMTGLPPSAVREIFVQYNVDDLLIKANMTLSDLRQVLEASLARTAGDIPAEVRASRLELWDEFRAWRDEQAGCFDDQDRSLRRDVLAADRLAAGKATDRELAALRAQIAALGSRRAVFELACARLKEILAGICTAEDVVAATRELRDAQRESGAAAGP